MLLQITNYCSEQCRHCFDDTTTDPKDHMSKDVFENSLKFLKRNEVGIIVVSGGEATEHPLCDEMVRSIKSSIPNVVVTLLSNGSFLSDDAKINMINGLYRDKLIDYLQITATPRWYKSCNLVFSNLHLLDMDDSKLAIHTGDIDVVKLGRGKSIDHASMKRPMCSNAYLVERQINSKSFKDIIKVLESSNQFCKPAILYDGSISVGETTNCRKIGSVTSGDEELCAAVSSTVPCDACGLVKNYGYEKQLIFTK
jgi:hypothetical protein